MVNVCKFRPWFCERKQSDKEGCVAKRNTLAWNYSTASGLAVGMVDVLSIWA